MCAGGGKVAGGKTAGTKACVFVGVRCRQSAEWTEWRLGHSWIKGAKLQVGHNYIGHDCTGDK